MVSKVQLLLNAVQLFDTHHLLLPGNTQLLHLHSTCTVYILYTHTKIPIIIKVEGRSGKGAVEKRQGGKKRRNLFHCSEGRLHEAVVESWLCLLQNGLHEVRQSLHSVYRSFEQGLQRRLVLLQLPQVATEGLVCLSVGGRRWGAINRAKKRET